MPCVDVRCSQHVLLGMLKCGKKYVELENAGKDCTTKNAEMQNVGNTKAKPVNCVQNR